MTTCEHCGVTFRGRYGRSVRFCSRECHRASVCLTPIERLNQRTLMSDEDSCWIWLGHLGPTGYGHISVGGSMQRAHRVAYEVYIGPITEGLHVMHSCDNPSCVNPLHLSLGTHAENMADMAAKNRAPRGSASLRAKLTEDDVCTLRERYAKGGETHRSLAREYGVSHGTIHRIINREMWRHV